MKRHAEATVTAERNDRAISIGEPCSECCRHGVAHAATARGLQIVAAGSCSEPLHHEQPVLTRITSDDGVVRDDLLDHLDEELGSEWRFTGRAGVDSGMIGLAFSACTARLPDGSAHALP